jgi:hypothetical protein
MTETESGEIRLLRVFRHPVVIYLFSIIGLVGLITVAVDNWPNRTKAIEIRDTLNVTSKSRNVVLKRTYD